MRDVQRQILSGQKTEASSEVVKKARQSLFEYSPVPFRGRGRRINRFMLGADPEFMFERHGEYLHASNFDLKPALAFGADQNTRLVEMRAMPSRSALEVVASILSTLRWLYRTCPAVQSCTWRAGAFAHRDGIGGHVHLGRKRSQRAAEVRALDGLAFVMRQAGLFPEAEWTRRSEGDQFGQRYGMYGDVRAQRHGYEYRTLPSWLTSPHLAFLVLTLAKLVVFDPTITADWMLVREDPWMLLRGLAKFYSGLDDDAWLLSSMMHRPELFQHNAGCFRARWGLSGEVDELRGLILPSVIEAAPADVEEMLVHFQEDAPLRMARVRPVPNWTHTIPSNYRWCMECCGLGRAAGAGDVIYDAVMSRLGFAVSFDWSGDDNRLRIHLPRSYQLEKELKTVLPGARTDIWGENGFHFQLGKSWRKGRALDEVRRVLFSGLFPLWKVNSVVEGDYEKWQQRAIKANASEGIYGQVDVADVEATSSDYWSRFEHASPAPELPVPELYVSPAQAQVYRQALTYVFDPAA